MPRFHKIYLEISDICKLKCTFCTPKKEQRGIMPIDLFQSIVSQVAIHTNLVSLHVLGDPLCISNIDSYIKIAKHSHLKLDIVSSGVFLQKEHFEILCDKAVHQVSFSLDAFYDNSKYNMKFNKSQEVYLNMLMDFYYYARKHAPNLYINLRLFNNYDYSILLDKFKGYIFQNEKRRIRLDKNLFLRFHKAFKWYNKSKSNIDILSKDTKKPYCLGGIKQLAILASGIVVPCCIDANALIPLGNINFQTFKEILESKIFIEFQKAQHSHVNLPMICKTCVFRGV